MPEAVGGPVRVEHAAVVASPVGPVAVVADELTVRSIRFGADSTVADLLDAGPPDGVAARAAAELVEYFAGAREEFTVEPDWPRIDETSAHVLFTLVRIAPYGRTVSYGELAAAAGITDRLPARVAGQILNSNPWPVLVPCHRVVMSDGSLGGFGSGVWRKELLLRHEGVLPTPLFD